MKIELYHDNFQNYRRYGIPSKAQLVIADIPYNLGRNAYASNPYGTKAGITVTARAKRQMHSSFGRTITLTSRSISISAPVS